MRNLPPCQHCGQPCNDYRCRYCSYACCHAARRAISTADRFWPRVRKTAGCWEWTGYLDKGGYGNLVIDNRQEKVHRVSWALHHGAIPDGMIVCHHCDNPACVRPDHLFLGTHQDNMTDKVNKGRAVCMRGSNNGNSKLTADIVRSIRARAAHGTETHESIALSVGVDRATVSSIVRRISWAWLD